MHAERSKSSGLRGLATIGLLLTLVGAGWMLLLATQGKSASIHLAQAERDVPERTATVETPASSAVDVPSPGSVAAPGGPASTHTIAELSPRLMIDSDLGTGSREFSAVALNEELNRLLIADDAGVLFEFDLDNDGLPIMPQRRTIRVQVGGGDIEGLSWLSGQMYVIAHEDDGSLTVVEIGDDVATLTDANLIRSIDSSIREVEGNGLEGVAAVPAGGGQAVPAGGGQAVPAGGGQAVPAGSDVEFVVVDERPPTILGISPTGSIVFSLDESFGLTDFSDIFVSPTSTYSVISDEGRAIVEFRVDGGQATELSRLDLELPTGRFEQPEGLVRSRDGVRLYVVGEAPGPDQFSFGFWSTNELND